MNLKYISSFSLVTEWIANDINVNIWLEVIIW